LSYILFHIKLIIRQIIGATIGDPTAGGQYQFARARTLFLFSLIINKVARGVPTDFQFFYPPWRVVSGPPVF